MVVVILKYLKIKILRGFIVFDKLFGEFFDVIVYRYFLFIIRNMNDKYYYLLWIYL